MRSDNEGSEAYDGQGLKGPLYWLSSDDLSGMVDYVETGVQKQG